METLTVKILDYLKGQSFQVAVVFAAVLILTWLLRNRSAHVRYLLWLLVAIKCLTPPMMIFSVPVLPAEAAPVITRPQSPDIEYPLMPTGYQQTKNTVITVTPTEMQIPIENQKSKIVNFLIAHLNFTLISVWAAGGAFYLLWAAIKAFRLQLWLKQNHRPVGPHLAGEIEELSRLWNPNKAFTVRLLDNISQPFVWGLWRGAIYLPSRIQSIQTDRQKAVVMHEMAHVIRWDSLLNLIQILIQGLFWFHPLVWLANRFIRQEREKCCDETAIARLNTQPKEYGSAIIETLVQEYHNAIPIPSLAVAGPIKNIEDRIKTIMQPGRRFFRRPSVIALLIIGILAALIIPTTIALTQADTPPNHIVTGTVTDAQTGTPIAGAEVFDDGYNGNKARTTAGDDGKFELKTWNEEHNISAKADGYESQQKTLLTFPLANNKNFNFQLKKISFDTSSAANSTKDVPPNHTVTGTVTDAQTGTPIAGAEVFDDGYNDNKAHTTAGGDGTFELKTWNEEHFISAGAKGYESHKQLLKTFPFANNKNFNFQLKKISFDTSSAANSTKDVPPNHIVTGTVTDVQTGAPIAGAEVFDDGYNGNKARTTAGDDGKFELKTWNEEHNISAKADGYESQQKTLLTFPLANNKNFNFQLKKIFNISSNAGTTNSSFIAALSNGVTIELLGICQYTATGMVCYQPDGTLLNQKLHIEKGSRITPKPGDYGIMLRTSGPQDWNLSYHSIAGNSGGWEGSCHVVDENGTRLEHCEAALTRFEPGQKTTTVQFGVASGPWETIAEHDGKSIDIANGISFTKANDTEQGVQIFATDTRGRNVTQRIVAIDYNGILHPWKGYTGSVSNSEIRQSIGTFPDLKLGQIKKFQFQTRPYEWVIFENVSLESGAKTDVKVEIQKPQDETKQIQAKTATADNPKFKKRFFVTLVADKDNNISSDGQKMTSEQIEATMSKVPDPSHTVLEMAVEAGTLPKEAQDELSQGKTPWQWLGQNPVWQKAGQLVQKYHLEYHSFIGENKPESRRQPLSIRIEDAFVMDKDITVAMPALSLQEDKPLLTVDTVRFAGGDPVLVANLNLTVISHPQKRWQVKMRLLDKTGGTVESVTKFYQNSGVIAGFAMVSKDNLIFNFKKRDLSTIAKFEIELRQMQSVPAQKTEAKTETPAETTDPNQAQIAVEARFILADEAVLKQAGIDLNKTYGTVTTLPPDSNDITDLFKNNTLENMTVESSEPNLLIDPQSESLMEWVRHSKNSKTLTCPKALVLNNEYATLEVHTDTEYFDAAEQLAEAVTFYLYRADGSHTISVDQIHLLIQSALASTGFDRAAEALNEHRLQRKLHRRRVMVLAAEDEQTEESRCSLWNKTRIVDTLMKNRRMDRLTARAVAAAVEDKVLRMGVSKVRSSLIRELVNEDAEAILRAEQQLQAVL